MRRRTFLSALPVGVLATSAAQAQQPSAASVPPAPARPADPYAGIGIGDRISGPKFMGRSTVWGANGAAATAHRLPHTCPAPARGHARDAVETRIRVPCPAYCGLV